MNTQKEIKGELLEGHPAYRWTDRWIDRCMTAFSKWCFGMIL